MSEILFLVEQAPDGNLAAEAFGTDIFSEVADIVRHHSNARDAVRCHFCDRKIAA